MMEIRIRILIVIIITIIIIIPYLCRNHLPSICHPWPRHSKLINLSKNYAIKITLLINNYHKIQPIYKPDKI
jgi:hypothetical protein